MANNNLRTISIYKIGVSAVNSTVVARFSFIVKRFEFQIRLLFLYLPLYAYFFIGHTRIGSFHYTYQGITGRDRILSPGGAKGVAPGTGTLYP